MDVRERLFMKLHNDLIVLDLETTGTWVERDKIIEIALIKTMPSGEEEIYEKRVNPNMCIPKVVEELTGISNADVQEAPLFKDIVREVITFIGEADFGGFNLIRFDLPLLERECHDAGCNFNWQNKNVYDAQKVFHVNEKRDLTAAYKFYCDKNLDNAHSALADTRATLEILESQVHNYCSEDNDINALQVFDYKKDTVFYQGDRRFRWWNGNLYIMFGKYAGKHTLQEMVKKDRGYLQWILSSDFTESIKDLIEDALLGKFPSFLDNTLTEENK